MFRNLFTVNKESTSILLFIINIPDNMPPSISFPKAAIKPMAAKMIKEVIASLRSRRSFSKVINSLQFLKSIIKV